MTRARRHPFQFNISYSLDLYDLSRSKEEGIVKQRTPKVRKSMAIPDKSRPLRNN
jgi:hypothetical protein